MIDSSRSSLGKEAAPHFQPFEGSDLHVWCASLSRSVEELSYYAALLSSEEKRRAKRFYFERDRTRYIVGRGILRQLLSWYLGTEASQVPITYGPHGKPMVEAEFRNKTLQFNLAHSNDWALYAFAWDRSVGIDLEHIRPMQDADDFAKTFFTERETGLINSLSGDQKWRAFFKLWTCKEAFLKAKGSGLMRPLNQVEVSLDRNDSATLTSMSEELEADKWRLELFNPMADYQAAIAIQGHEGQIIFQRL